MNSLRDHLLSRDCFPEYYSVILDESTMTATFLCFAYGTGKYVGYQAYKPNAPKKRSGDMKPSDLKYFSHAVDGELLIWGFEGCDFTDDRRLFVVEGIFDACKLQSMGLNAVAVLGNTPRFGPWARASGLTTIAVCDGDKAGHELARSCLYSVVCPEGEDPSSMTKESLYDLLRMFQ